MPEPRYSKKLGKWLVPTGDGRWTDAPGPLRPSPDAIDVRGGMKGVNVLQPPATPEVTAAAADSADKLTRNFGPGILAGLSTPPSGLAGAYGAIKGGVEGVTNTVRGERLPGYEDKPLSGIGEFVRRSYEDAVTRAEQKAAKGFNTHPLGYLVGKGVQQTPMMAAGGAQTLLGKVGIGMLVGGGLGIAENGRDPVTGGIIGAATGGLGGLGEAAMGTLGKTLLKHGGSASVGKFGPKIGEIVDEATANGATIPWDSIEGELRTVRDPLAKHPVPQARNVASQIDEIIGNLKNGAGHEVAIDPSGLDVRSEPAYMTPRALHDAKGALAEFAGFHKARQTPGQEALGQMTGIAKNLEEAAIAKGAPARLNEFKDAKDIYGPAVEGAAMADASRNAGLLGPSGAPRLTPVAGYMAGGPAGAAAAYGLRKFGPTVGQGLSYAGGLAARAMAPGVRMTVPVGLNTVNLVKWLMDNPPSGQEQ